jgi:putative copper resistance protein D
LIDPLIIARDIHFASSVVVAGIIFFDLLVASPALRANSSFPATEQTFRATAEKLLWISIPLSIASALAWLLLLSMRIAHKPLAEMLADGTAWTVLTRTQFGLAWQMRLVTAAALVTCLFAQRKSGQGRASTGLAVLAGLMACAYLGSLAFAGHGTQGVGLGAVIHVAADVLHLIGAGLWLGALIPFALLLACLHRFEEDGWVSSAAAAGNRFSTLAIVAVGTLLASGMINAWFLLVSLHNLVDTSYGRLLLFKVVLFAVMLSLAGINRQHLLPRLRDDAEPGQATQTVRELLRNSLIEIVLGASIILIVGMLGIMAPANEMASHVH